MFHSWMIIAVFLQWNTDIKYAKIISETVKFILYYVSHVTMFFIEICSGSHRIVFKWEEAFGWNTW